MNQLLINMNAKQPERALIVVTFSERALCRLFIVLQTPENAVW